MDEPKKTDQFNTSNSSSGSASGGVMDIQSPKTSSDTAPILPDSNPQSTDAGNPVAPSAEPEPQLDNTGLGQIKPVEEPAAADISLSGNETDTAAAAASQTSAPTTDQGTNPAPATSPLAIPPNAAHKGNGPVVAIVVAIVVALALAGLVVFTLAKTKDNSAGTNSSAGPAPVVSKPLASPADVDATSQELESSLNKIDEDKDFSSEELSDKSLGL